MSNFTHLLAHSPSSLSYSQMEKDRLEATAEHTRIQAPPEEGFTAGGKTFGFTIDNSLCHNLDDCEDSVKVSLEQRKADLLRHPQELRTCKVITHPESIR